MCFVCFILLYQSSLWLLHFNKLLLLLLPHPYNTVKFGVFAPKDDITNQFRCNLVYKRTPWAYTILPILAMIGETVCTRGPKFKSWSQSRHFGGFARKGDGIYRWRWSLACTLPSFSHANGSVQGRRMCTGAPRFHSYVKSAVFRRVCSPSWRQYRPTPIKAKFGSEDYAMIHSSMRNLKLIGKGDAYGSPHITTLGQNRGICFDGFRPQDEVSHGRAHDGCSL